jgi:hypothetical protein
MALSLETAIIILSKFRDARPQQLREVEKFIWKNLDIETAQETAKILKKNLKGGL